ncbi:MAG: TraR/DksA family transcriptional regulator [Candidatus Limnocylindrales bacterium]
MDVVHRDARRASLAGERERLIREIGEAIVAPSQMTYGSQAAAASQVFEQQRDLALRDQASARLRLVQEALGRLDDATYGACLQCARSIPLARLDALPWAALCVGCQAARDRGRR